MAESHVITFLTTRRAELLGKVAHAQAALDQFLADLGNVDATLRMIVPDIDLKSIAPKPVRRPNPVARMDTTRVVLDELRRSSEPLSTRELTIRAMRLHALNPDTPALVRTARRRVHFGREVDRDGEGHPPGRDDPPGDHL